MEYISTRRHQDLPDTTFLVMDVSRVLERLRPMEDIVEELNDYYQEELGETNKWTNLAEFLLQLLLEKTEEVDASDKNGILSREKSRMENNPSRAVYGRNSHT